MSNELQLLTTREFNGVTLDCYKVEDDSSDFWATREQIGQLLGYKRPRHAIANLHNRYRERLDKFSGVLKLSTPSGGTQNVIVYNFKGLLEICRYSNQPNANEVIDKLWEIADEIRRTGMYMTDRTLEVLKHDPEAFNLLLKQYVAEHEKKRELQKRIDQTAGYTLLGQIVMARNDAFTFQEAAQFLCEHGFDIGQNRLFKYCREKRLLCSRRGRQWNHPLQSAVARGLLNIQVSGDKRARTITMILPRGLQYLANELSKEFYPIFALEIDD